MKSSISAIVSGVAALLALGLSTGAAAQSTVWNYGSVANTCDAGPTCAAFSGPAGNAAVTGYMTTTTSGTNFVTGTVTNQGSSGLGFNSNGSESNPDHAFDNRNGGGVLGTATTEMLLIGFGANKVNLTAIALGWTNTDSDVSVLRWDGAAATPPLTTTNGTANLVASGWALVSSRDVDNTGGSTGDTAGGTFTLSAGTGYNASSNGKLSSWWLVSTYFGSAIDNTGTNQDLDAGSNDFFKILSFTGNICVGANGGNGGLCGGGNQGVPEPASLALVGLAIAGVIGSRRRQRKTI